MIISQIVVDGTAAFGWLWTAVAAIGVVVVGFSVTVAIHIAALSNAKKRLEKANDEILKLRLDVNALRDAYNHQLETTGTVEFAGQDFRLKLPSDRM